MDELPCSSNAAFRREVRISDTGQGISWNFLYLQSLSAATRRRRGSRRLGIGTAIVKQLVELHGGGEGELGKAKTTVRFPFRRTRDGGSRCPPPTRVPVAKYLPPVADSRWTTRSMRELVKKVLDLGASVSTPCPPRSTYPHRATDVL
jgi:hypothetical protein